MRRILTPALLACVLAAPVLVYGQADPATPSEQRTVDMADREDRGEWGWIGLVGLAGLLGLKRRDREDHAVRRPT